ncbi:tetratricopeptide repeat protein [candidate division WOR-3 bacterium]|nr:tetratricopeptide repeat protein [candidate division WOR-3 bacterium]
MKKNSVAVQLIVLLVCFSSTHADDLDDAYEFMMVGQYNKAIAPFERALATASNKADIYYNLGVCYEKTGNIEKALSNYRKAGSIRDAPSKVQQLEKEIKDRNIARLRREAQSAYDAMNYGVAQSKAEEILRLDPANSWARNLTNEIREKLSLPADTLDTAEVTTPDTSLGSQTDTATQADTTRLVEGEVPVRTPMPVWLVVLIMAAVLIVGFGVGILIGKLSKKETVERALRTLLRLLPAGMVSVRKGEKLSLLFFEKGKVIKAVVEEADGVKIGGRGVAEELLGTTCEYEDKPEGPWSKFAELMIEVYRHAQVEAGKAKFSFTTKVTQKRKKK